jgi:NAD(P)-dependent dehydrogenase (short-subunit alcohol dehydrogenase family)
VLTAVLYWTSQTLSTLIYLACFAVVQVTMASNYFGPLYLTLQLLDVLQASAPSRVVWVNSVGSQLVNPPYLGGNSWAPGG